MDVSTVISAKNLEEVQAVVRSHSRLLARGAGTKPGLSMAEDAAVLDVSALTGVVEYDPGEFTITVRAGTPLAELETLLASNGQSLPFDPPRAAAGATVGGTLAAGLSGSGRFRYGGLRDFVIGVVFVDGEGRRVRGGGKVVKNAAGFDLPKLFAGSLGRLGVMVEVTFKVFPFPRARTTVRLSARDLDDALDRLTRLTQRDWGLEALDLDPPATLWLRLAGDEHGLETRCARLAETLGCPLETLASSQEGQFWKVRSALASPQGGTIIKVPVTPARIPALDAALERIEVNRRYAAGGQLAWLGWPEERALDDLDRLLGELGLGGLALDRPGERCRLGADPARSFLERVKRALDPLGRFPGL